MRETDKYTRIIIQVNCTKCYNRGRKYYRNTEESKQLILTRIMRKCFIEETTQHKSVELKDV